MQSDPTPGANFQQCLPIPADVDHVHTCTLEASSDTPRLCV